MDATSIKTYLKPYGRLLKLRGHNLRSTFRRITSAFDEYDRPRVDRALTALGQTDLRSLSCVYCGRPAQQWDHLEEAAHGGGHQIGNLVPACAKCNARKKPWRQHLQALDLSESERQDRAGKLEAYVELLETGHRLFDESEKKQLEAIESEILAAMERADRVIENAEKRFLAKWATRSSSGPPAAVAELRR